MQRIIRKVLQNASLTVIRGTNAVLLWIADGFRCARTTNVHGRGGNLRIGRARDRRKNGVTFTVTPFFAAQ